MLTVILALKWGGKNEETDYCLRNNLVGKIFLKMGQRN